MHWKIRDRSLTFDRVLLMGILNITPDSFSDGNSFLNPENALKQARALIRDGADILDLGAESTRPNAPRVSADEELARLLPVLKQIKRETNTPISIDTTKPEVAEACLLAGAEIINDVSGLKDSGEKMAKLICDHGAGIVLMHRRGNPQTMQSMTSYNDLLGEVMSELNEQIQFAQKMGISPEQIVIDPGIGFSKNADQNLGLTANLNLMCDMGYPVLYGASRKSFLGQVTGKEVHDREYGTAAATAIAILKGARILRVHDVKAMKDVALVAQAVGNYQTKLVSNI